MKAVFALVFAIFYTDTYAQCSIFSSIDEEGVMLNWAWERTGVNKEEKEFQVVEIGIIKIDKPDKTSSFAIVINSHSEDKFNPKSLHAILSENQEFKFETKALTSFSDIFLGGCNLDYPAFVIDKDFVNKIQSQSVLKIYLELDSRTLVLIPSKNFFKHQLKCIGI